MVKIQVIQSDEEKHSLSQDLARMLSEEKLIDTVVECAASEKENPIYVHSIIIKSRSDKLGKRIKEFSDEKNKVCVKNEGLQNFCENNS